MKWRRKTATLQELVPLTCLPDRHALCSQQDTAISLLSYLFPPAEFYHKCALDGTGQEFCMRCVAGWRNHLSFREFHRLFMSLHLLYPASTGNARPARRSMHGTGKGWSLEVKRGAAAPRRSSSICSNPGWRQWSCCGCSLHHQLVAATASTVGAATTEACNNVL
jgi:hypothetical protein